VKAWVRKGGLGAVVAVAIVAATLFGAAIMGRYEPVSDLTLPTRSVAPGLVRIDAAEGSRLLFESEARAAFLPLISHFETQQSLVHCGPASIAMVLNAMELPTPPAPTYHPYRLFTQENVLNDLTDSIIGDRALKRRGMFLSDVAQVLGIYGASVDMRYADAANIDTFRTLAAEYLGKPRHHVIVTYSRTALGQEGGGHISPLGAYHADSDRFLILDVARYKAPAVWVSTRQLFMAMAKPKSANSPQSRGFLLVRASSDGDRGAGPVVAAPM
jgi:hypothetical protein